MLCKELDISIHAPREGGDYQWALDAATLKVISIHAPREGGDPTVEDVAAYVSEFQSTPPARGATAKMHSFTCGSLTNK